MNKFGHLFCQSSYGKGSFDVKFWIDRCVESGVSFFGFAEYNNLATVISAYNKCKDAGISYIPAMKVDFIPDGVYSGQFVRSRLIFSARTEKAYKELIKINNTMHRSSFYFIGNKRGSDRFRLYADWSFLDTITRSDEFEDIDIIFPFHETSLYNIVQFLDLTEENWESKKINMDILMRCVTSLAKMSYDYRKPIPNENKTRNLCSLSIPICEDAVINYGILKFVELLSFLNNPVTLWQESLREDLIEYCESAGNFFLADLLRGKDSEHLQSFCEENIFFSTFAQYPTKKDYEIALIHRGMDGYFKTYPLLGAHIRSDKDLFKEVKKNLPMHQVKQFIKNNLHYCRSANFDTTLNNYVMPEVSIPSDLQMQVGISTPKEFIEFLIVNGWNDCVKRHNEGNYNGSWGEDNAKEAKSINEIYALNTKRSDRLKEEYEVIESMGFISYFLIVAEICSYCDTNGYERNRLGRGSAAGSFLSFLLGITGADPIDSPYYDDLLFERFLNPSRATMPDIDLDFSDETREKVFDYLKKKYGANRVVRIGTYQKLKVKSAIKLFHKSNEYYLPKNNNREYLRLIKEHSQYYGLDSLNIFLADKAINKVKQDRNPEEVLEEFCEVSPRFNSFYERHKHWIDNCIIPVCRSVKSKGIHPGGILITPSNVDEWIPIRYENEDPEGEMISHYEMEECEMAGLVKIDCLGLKSISMIARAKELVKKYRGIELPTISDLPLDDTNVLAELKRDSYGVFQFKSNIQRNYLPRLNPSDFKDLVNAVSLCRTGPMAANAHEDYIKLKRGEIEPEIEHESMVKSLESTGGLIIYQEQVMKLLQDMAGFSLAEADNIRRAIGKKKADLLDSYKNQFIDGCKDNGIPESTAETVWEKIDYFSGYGFNMCVTGDTTLALPYYPLEDFEKGTKDIVHIPVIYLYYAMHLESMIPHAFSDSDIDSFIVDEDLVRRNLMDLLDNNPENIMPDMDCASSLLYSESKFRDRIQFDRTEEFKKLVQVFETKCYGPIISYLNGIGIKNNIVDIIRVKTKVPIIKISTPLQGLYLKGAPSHRVLLYDPKNDKYQDVPLSQVKVGDKVICIDLMQVDSFFGKESEEVGFNSEKSIEDQLATYGEDSIRKIQSRYLNENVRPVAKVAMEAIPPSDLVTIDQNKHWEVYGIPAYVDTVTQVDYMEEPEYVYEVVLRDPVHHYASNGIVSHNSHAVSYSWVGWYMAYLKTYYPIEYWCGVLSYAHDDKKQSNNKYELKYHLESIGVEFEYPNLYNFRVDFSPVEGKRVSWPITAISGIGEKFSSRLYRASGKTGTFEDVKSMLYLYREKIGTNVDIGSLKILFIAGFFDKINFKNETYYGDKARNIAFLMIRASKLYNESQLDNLMTLVETLSDPSEEFYLRCKYYKFLWRGIEEEFASRRPIIDDDSPFSAFIPDDHDQQPPDSLVRLCGVITRVRPHTDRNGNRMLFIELTNKMFIYKVVVFASSLELFPTDEIPKVADAVEVFGTKQHDPKWGYSLIVHDTVIQAEEGMIYPIYKLGTVGSESSQII